MGKLTTGGLPPRAKTRPLLLTASNTWLLLIAICVSGGSQQPVLASVAPVKASWFSKLPFALLTAAGLAVVVVTTGVPPVCAFPRPGASDLTGGRPELACADTIEGGGSASVRALPGAS